MKVKVLWERSTSKYIKLKSNINIYIENEIIFFFLGNLSICTWKQQHFDYPWKLLRPPYKYTKAAILIATHKKAIAIATNMKKKKTFCSFVGGWYMWLKVKEFYVFESIELLFLNSLFQNKYF